MIYYKELDMIANKLVTPTNLLFIVAEMAKFRG